MYMKMDRHSRIVLMIIGGVAIVLIAVAIVVAVQPPHEFDPGTPEGTVQAYFQAILDGDEDLALSYLEEDLTTDCSTHELQYVTPDSARVVIEQTEIDGDEASVDVVITETWGEGPFGGGSNTFDETLIMTRDGETWVISQIPWPINMLCHEGG
ncbi:MAG: hypothetical protein U9N79_01985 [Actinomycetota bacterium]|nr:hypothetical protein [Actinomycetota bacterium]